MERTTVQDRSWHDPPVGEVVGVGDGAEDGGVDGADRRRQLDTRLAVVRERIAGAAVSAGRDPGSVTVIAVTKTCPASDVRHLAALGVLDFGENRDQEASAKAAETADLPLRWHFIGQLQTNKARSVLRYADVIHSVDRLRLVTALSRAAEEAGREVTCLVQVNLDADAAAKPKTGAKPEIADAVPEGGSCRGGVAPADAPALADALAEAPHLRLGGIMAVAPRGGDARAAFGRMVPVAERVRRDHPDAVILSAGMSGDLEAAVAAGATHVRVGTALLGLRPPLG